MDASNIQASVLSPLVPVASSGMHFANILGRRAHGGSKSSRPSRRQQQTNATIGAATYGSQTERAHASRPSRRVANDNGIALPHPDTLRLQVQLHAAEQQLQQYRSRVHQLERQVHITQAAAMGTSTNDFMHPTGARNVKGADQYEEKQPAQSRTRTSQPTLPPLTLPPFQPSSARKNSDTSHASASDSSGDTAALRTEVRGLHSLLNDYEETFTRQQKELETLRMENERLRMQLSLTNNLTGLLTAVGMEKFDADANTSAGTQQSMVIGQPLPPAWLKFLQQCQKDDEDNPALNHSSATESSSPLASPARVSARASALKYILSSLTPHLNLRDRVLSVLLDEWMREHAWNCAQLSRQSTVLRQLIEYLHKKEFRATNEEEENITKQYFKQKQKEHEANVLAAAATMSTNGNRPVTSGLVPGSAGALPRRLQPTPPSSSVTPSFPPSTSSRSGISQVQVDGNGSHVIASGASWLQTEEDDRPFASQPELASATNFLRHHQTRFVTGAAAPLDVPQAALQEEENFLRYQHTGYSGQAGGTATSSVVGLPLTPSTETDEESRVFRTVDGTSHAIPASVRKWSSVQQLDYVPSQSDHAPRFQLQRRSSPAPTTTISPSPTPTPPAQQAPTARRRRHTRNYTQTALGVLSESTNDSEEKVQLENPFAARSGLDQVNIAAIGRIEQAANIAELARLPHLGAASPYSTQTTDDTQYTPAAAIHGSSPSSSPSLSPSLSPSSLSDSVPLTLFMQLYDLMRFISFKLQHEKQLRHVVHALKKMVGSDRVTLWFVDHERGHIWSTIGTAVTNEIRVKLGVGIAGTVAATGRGVTLTNATYDHRFLKKIESGTDYVTRAVMCIPLQTPKHGTFAVMQIMNKKSPSGVTGGSSSHVNNSGVGYFTRTDELLAHVLCAHLSQNLWSSEMFQLALRERLKTQHVFKHAELLVSCAEVKEMIEALVNRTRLLMDADYAVLFARNTSPKVTTNDQHGNQRTSKSRKRLTSRRSSTVGATTTWSESVNSQPAAPVEEELLTVAESCAPQLAILIPQGYATDRHIEGFQFNCIRVPLNAGGLACQSARKGLAFNITDTRSDSRFDSLLDEYISDIVTGDGPSGTRSLHTTRAFVSLPIASSADPSQVDGVLVLGKLAPRPFQSWEVSQLDEVRSLLWIAIKRYRQDRQVNSAMHERLEEINRMVGTLDVEAGGSCNADGEEEDTIDRAVSSKSDIDAFRQSHESGSTSRVTASNGFPMLTSSLAVVVTEEGALSNQMQQAAARLRDPASGEALPSLEEYQRTRMQNFPHTPRLGSTLADALYRGAWPRDGTTMPPLPQPSMSVTMSHAQTHSSSLGATSTDTSLRTRTNLDTRNGQVERMKLQKEVEADQQEEASNHGDEDDADDQQPKQQTKHGETKPTEPPPTSNPLNSSETSHCVTFDPNPSPENNNAGMQPKAEPTVVPPSPSRSDGPVVTLHKPPPPSLLPTTSNQTTLLASLSTFHAQASSGIKATRTPDSASSPSNTSPFAVSLTNLSSSTHAHIHGPVPSIPPPSTVSRITQRNVTDYPELDAIKVEATTYGPFNKTS